MISQPLSIPEVLLLEPTVHRDARGFFTESFHCEKFAGIAGHPVTFVQENFSLSVKNVLRGLHYQIRHPQAKLVRVTSGSIFDVAVDLRVSSPTFGKWTGAVLSAENLLQMWIPEGFAHGFVTLEEETGVLYKTTDFYAPAYERAIAWNDPFLNIDWPLASSPILSSKDSAAPYFSEAELFP